MHAAHARHTTALPPRPGGARTWTFLMPSMRRSRDSGFSVLTACTTMRAKKSRSPDTWPGHRGCGGVAAQSEAGETQPGARGSWRPAQCATKRLLKAAGRAPMPAERPSSTTQAAAAHQLGVEARLRALLQQRLALLAVLAADVRGQLAHAPHCQLRRLAERADDGLRVAGSAATRGSGQHSGLGVAFQTATSFG